MRVAPSERRRGVPVSISSCQKAKTDGTGFYLITTDILGPYGVGFAMGTLGWMPGKFDGKLLPYAR